MNPIISHVEYVSALYVDSRQQDSSVQNAANETVDILIHWTCLSTNICLFILITWESDYDKIL